MLDGRKFLELYLDLNPRECNVEEVLHHSKIGDLLGVIHPYYIHFGIVSSLRPFRVISFTTPEPFSNIAWYNLALKQRAKVIETDMDVFCWGSHRLIRFGSNCCGGMVCVNEARKYIHSDLGGYNLLNNNCETFAFTVLFGKKCLSRQSCSVMCSSIPFLRLLGNSNPMNTS